MEDNAISIYLSKEWNKKKIGRPIEYIESRLLELRNSDGSSEYFNLEKYIAGWVGGKKWLDNSGSVCDAEGISSFYLSFLIAY